MGEQQRVSDDTQQPVGYAQLLPPGCIERPANGSMSCCQHRQASGNVV